MRSTYTNDSPRRAQVLALTKSEGHPACGARVVGVYTGADLSRLFLLQMQARHVKNKNTMESQGARIVLDVFLFLLTSIYYVLEAIFLTLVPLRLRCDPQRLRGQIALVTGGAGGVGRHLCVKLALRGTTVVIWDLNADGGLLSIIFSSCIFFKIIMNVEGQNKLFLMEQI